MLNLVKTVVTNKSRTPFRLACNRGQTLTFLPGKQETFDFDLVSLLDRTGKTKLQTAVNRGILTVTTKIFSETTLLTIDGKDIKVSPYIAEAPKQVSPIKKGTTPKVSDAPATDDTYIGGKSGGVANKSEEKFKAAFGVSTESRLDDIVESVAVPANGKLEKTAAAVPLKKVNTKAEDTVSVFKSEVADKEMIEQKTVSGEQPEKNIQQEITKYLEEKDYNIVYAWLEENHSDVFPGKLTKPNIKKCHTYEELMEAVQKAKDIIDE